MISGRTPGGIFNRRVNEACGRESCPYALLANRVMDSPKRARSAYRKRCGRLPDERFEGFDLHVWKIEVRSEAIGIPDSPGGNTFLSELDGGPVNGAAWTAVRHHIDHSGLEAIVIPGHGCFDLLVLFHRADELLNISYVEPLQA